MAEFLSVNMRGNLDAAIDQFAGKLKGTAFVGAQAMAQVVYESAKSGVPVKSGKLRDAIYQVQSKDNSTETRAEYHVSWNHNKAPHGHLVEFGTSRAPAHPFLYPAYEQNKGQLIATANEAMSAKLNELGK